MKFRFVLSTFLALLLPLSIPLSVVAEDAEEEQKPPPQQAETPKKKSTSSTAPTKTKNRSSEREFDPSEEISEDLSVPFPVDI